MNSKPTIFLDTSVQIERILGAKANQAEIEQRLATPHLQFITSLIPAFLAAHKPQLHTIIDHLTTHPTCLKEQGRVERLLKVVLEKPQEALGQSVCWPLGDVIIALQIPAHVKLWTLDADLIALSKALDIALYQPDELNQTSE